MFVPSHLLSRVRIFSMRSTYDEIMYRVQALERGVLRGSPDVHQLSRTKLSQSHFIICSKSRYVRRGSSCSRSFIPGTESFANTLKHATARLLDHPNQYLLEGLTECINGAHPVDQSEGVLS